MGQRAAETLNCWALMHVRIIGTVYTERYMGMPNFSDNYRGYEQADVTRRETIEKFHNKKFLIIHGTADQKVHLQHTLHFTKELVKNGITFKEQVSSRRTYLNL